MAASDTESRLLRAAEGKTRTNGGMNIDEFRREMLRKYPALEDKIRKANRQGLSTIYFDQTSKLTTYNFSPSIIRNDKLTYNQLLELNFRWWSTPGSLHSQHPYIKLVSSYDRDQILEENPSSNLLIEINRYIITVNSQDGTSDAASEASLPVPEFLDQFSDGWKYKGYKSVENQKAYVDFWADKSTSLKIQRGLMNSEDIAFHAETYNKGNLSNIAFLQEKMATIDGSIPLTMVYFPQIGAVINFTNFNTGSFGKDKIQDFETMSKVVSDYDDLYYWRVLYRYWGNKNIDMALPPGSKQSDKESSYDYMLQSILDSILQ